MEVLCVSAHRMVIGSRHGMMALAGRAEQREDGGIVVHFHLMEEQQ